MAEDSPVESDEDDSDRVEDGGVDDEDDERRRHPAPGGRRVEPSSERDVRNAEHGGEDEHEGEHHVRQHSASQTARILRRRRVAEQLRQRVKIERQQRWFGRRSN